MLFTDHTCTCRKELNLTPHPRVHSPPGTVRWPQYVELMWKRWAEVSFIAEVEKELKVTSQRTHHWCQGYMYGGPNNGVVVSEELTKVALGESQRLNICYTQRHAKPDRTPWSPLRDPSGSSFLLNFVGTRMPSLRRLSSHSAYSSLVICFTYHLPSHYFLAQEAK